jgi:tyrosyl-tRNA synthetase
MLMRDLRGKESSVLTTVFLEGTDGRKMSKSWGNAVWLDDEPREMYGKLMSVRDELLVSYLTMATDLPLTEIAGKERRLAEGENPMIIKKELAHRVVSELSNQAAADAAQRHFEETFQEGKAPPGILSISVDHPLRGNDLIDLITAHGLVKSKSAVRRLLEQGAISVVDGEKVVADSVLKPPVTLRIGKRSFIRLV